MPETEAWIWVDQDDARIESWAYYDHSGSSFASSKVLSHGSISQNSGMALFDIDSEIGSLDKFHCLPASASAPVVDALISEMIIRVAGELAVQFYPVIVRARDGETDRFSFAIPRHHISCTDLERSEVKVWIVPGQVAGSMGSLYHKPNCLGIHHFARDMHFDRQILVSQELKSALEETGDPGLNFVRPEDYQLSPPAFG